MKNYINPNMDILWFDEEEDILTTSANQQGYTAAQDVMAQMENVAGSNMSVATIRIENIQVK